MSNQIVISSGAKVRNLDGVLTGTAGIVNSVPLGAANGVATLDALGKVPLSQLPASVVTYLGTWNAATNTPTLANGTGDVGDLYICNVAGTVNFGAGPITFAVGDWVIYSGTQWQKSAGSSGTVTSVAMTVPTGLSVAGSPITTSGTLAVSLASGYTIPTTSFLSGLVPYTGATQTVDLGSYDLNARGIKINGTAGTGHADFKHQSGTPTGSASSTTLFANSDGNMAWLNDHLYITTIVTNANTADRSYTFPDYSGTVALLSGSQTFSGQKTFSSVIIGDSGVSLKEGVIPSAVGYTGLAGDPDGLVISKKIGTTSYTNLLSFTSATSNTYTFPNDSGTIALTSNLNGYVPYSGATMGLDLGIYSYNGNNVIINGNSSTQNGTLLFKQVGSLAFNSVGYTGIGILGTTAIHFNFNQSSGVYKQFNFDVSGLTVSSTRTYNMPDSSGTLALTSNFSSYVPYSGATASLDLGGYSLVFNNSQAVFGRNSTGTTSYALIGVNPSNKVIIDQNSIGTVFGGNVDLGTYNLTGNLIYNKGLIVNQSSGTANAINFEIATSGQSISGSGYVSLLSNATDSLSVYFGGSTKVAKLLGSSLTTTRTYTLPDATGTIALTSNIPTVSGTTNYHAKFTGTSTLGNSLIWDNGTNVGIGNTNTTYTFDVTGTGRFTSTLLVGSTLTASGNLNLQGSATRNINFYDSSNTNINAQIQYDQLTSNTGQLFFGTNNAGTFGTKMTITSSGNVGINTSSPGYTLHVNGSIYGSSIYSTIYYSDGYSGTFAANNNTGYTPWQMNGNKGGYGGFVDVYSGMAVMHDSGGSGGFYRSASNKWTIYYSSGNNCVGIGGSTTYNWGRACTNGTMIYTSESYAMGAMYATAFNVTSDRRIKENIVPIDSSLDKVMKLQGVYFNKIETPEKKQIGFIAQDVQEIVPEAVNYFEHTDLYMVDYPSLVALLAEAIKELKQEIDILKQKA